MIRKTAVLTGWSSGSIHLLPATASFFYTGLLRTDLQRSNQAITYYQGIRNCPQRKTRNHKPSMNALRHLPKAALTPRVEYCRPLRCTSTLPVIRLWMPMEYWRIQYRQPRMDMGIYDSEEESLENSSLAARLAYNSSSLYALIRPLSTVNCTMHYRKVISMRGVFLDRRNIHNTGGITNNGLGGSALTSYAAQGCIPTWILAAKYTLICRSNLVYRQSRCHAFQSFPQFRCISSKQITATWRLQKRKQAITEELIRDSHGPSIMCDKAVRQLLDAR